MPGTVAVQVDCHRHTGDMGGKNLDINCQRRHPATVSHWSDTQVIDSLQNLPFQLSNLGVGIGGTAERTLMLAKKALLRKIGEPSPDAEIAELEGEILQRVNNLGIGPMGYGGRVTALAVNIEVFPAHIASMPVAVNLNCHSARHKEAIL